MTDAVIQVENLGKRYVLGARQEGRQYKALRDTLADMVRAPWKRRQSVVSPAEEFWALRDVSFEIKRGDIVGIVGRNGAGKSTLLKILSRITEPTGGRITLRGRVASLLEVGTGFHPELTGRENIYLNGAILGMHRHEIKAKFDEIAAFAEVERFLDTPVKRYSSGMYVRLAFAVAAHLEPEILVVDEVLAVGDAQFQKKCLGKMGEVARGGRTVLFVSHSITALRSLCHSGLCLEAGRLVYHGKIDDAIDHYLSARANAVSGLKYNPRPEPPVDRRLFYSGFSVQTLDGTPVTNIDSSAPLLLKLEVTARIEATSGVNVRFRSRLGYLLWMDSDALQRRQFTFPKGVSIVTCRIDPTRLTAGNYAIDLALTIHNQEWIDHYPDACNFEIAHFDPYASGFELTEVFSVVHLPHEWDFIPANNSHAASPDPT